MSDSRAAGVFLGHTEGLTYVDSKGDGRYVLSNGKDQNMKLWDLRKMMSTEKAQDIDLTRYTTGYDYRFQPYDNIYRKHPHDCSLVTYKGHKVLKTLIRCHFSPPGSTDSRYVYSGSEDGSVFIYNMDATLAGKVDVTMATKNTRPRGGMITGPRYDYEDRQGGSWMTCVRDASWHPNAPVIAGKLPHHYIAFTMCRTNKKVKERSNKYVLQQLPGTAMAQLKAPAQYILGMTAKTMTKPTPKWGSG